MFPTMFRAGKEVSFGRLSSREGNIKMMSHIWETLISSGELKVWSAPEPLVGKQDHVSSFTPNSHRTLQHYRTQTVTVEISSGSLLQSGWSTGVKRNHLFDHKCPKVISEFCCCSWTVPDQNRIWWDCRCLFLQKVQICTDSPPQLEALNTL